MRQALTVAKVRQEVRQALRAPEQRPVSHATKTEAASTLIRAANRVVDRARITMTPMATTAATPEERMDRLRDYVAHVVPGYFSDDSPEFNRKVETLESQIGKLISRKHMGLCFEALMRIVSWQVEEIWKNTVCKGRKTKTA